MSSMKGTVVAGVFALAAVALAGALAKEVRTGRRAVTVKGFAQQRIESDYAIWNASLVVRSPAMAEGYKRMEGDAGKVRAYLVSQGVKEEELSGSSVTINARYKQSLSGMFTNEVELYELNQTVGVKSADVKLVEKVAKGVTLLIQDGVELQSWEPAFHYTKLDDLKIQMLGGAAQDAKQRAVEIAEKSGAKIGRLASASQGVFQITPVYSSEISGEGWLDTSSIEKTIRAVVTVSYELK